MPSMVSGGNGRSDRRSVRCVLFPLAVVFLLSLGVAAVPEEQHNAAVPEQPKQEVVCSVTWPHLVLMNVCDSVVSCKPIGSSRPVAS